MDKHLRNAAILMCYWRGCQPTEENVKNVSMMVTSLNESGKPDWLNMGRILPELVYKHNGDVTQIHSDLLKNMDQFPFTFSVMGPINRYDAELHVRHWNEYRKSV